ncbi:hypothetical protein [Rhodococcus ruber]|uniref:hypothetical protein n=1 Tax=Rhodococcus ruber TaxID=1830 RepID=UPI0037853010
MDNGEGGEPVEIQMQAVWPEGVSEQAQVVNQFALLNDNTPGEPGVYLLVGHLGAPIWLTPEIARQRAAEANYVLPIAPRGAYFMTRQRAEELWSILGKHLGKDITQE